MKKIILAIGIIFLCFSSIKSEAKYWKNIQSQPSPDIINSSKTNTLHGKDLIEHNGTMQSSCLKPDILVFNFGNVCVGSTKKLKKTFEPLGNYTIYIADIKTTQQYHDLWEAGFNVTKYVTTTTPSALIHNHPKKTEEWVIVFTPTKAGIFSDTIELQLSHFINNEVVPIDETLTIVVTGQGIENNISVNPTEIKEKLEVNKLKEYSINITSNSLQGIEITSAVIQPERKHISFNLLNTFPLYLAPDCSELITFTAVSDTAAAYSGYIKLSLRSEIGGCINTVNIPLNIDFLDVKNKFTYTNTKGEEVKNISAISMCSNQVFFDTIYVSNRLPYTFKSLKFNDASSQYNIVQCPKLPLKVKAEDKIKIIISNPMIKEGIVKDALVFEMQNDADNKISFDTIFTQYEFVTTDINISDTNIDFGIFEICDENNTKEIEIINKGSLDEVLYINIKNIPDYYKLNKNVIYLSPNSKERIKITFIPSKVHTVPNYDTTKITVNSMVCPTEFEFTLYSIVDSISISVNPKTINFGKIQKNYTSSKEIEIQNNSPFDVYLTQFDFIPNLYFTTNIQLPILIQKYKTEIIPVYFSSPETNIYNSAIHLTIERSCSINDSIDLTAEIDKMELVFRVSKHDRVSPNLTNYEIPIYLKSNSTELNNVNIENIELELDRTLFYPKKVNVGNISKTIDTNKRIINISDININHLNANEELELCRINGNVLLGQTDSTGIIIRDVKVSPESQNIFENGYLTIKTCTQGGNRLINYRYSPKLKIENNPVINDVVNVECNVIEQGEHYLSIVNYLGKEIILKKWKVQDNVNKLQFTIPANDLCSGTYILVLTTPTKKYSTNIVIVR